MEQLSNRKLLIAYKDSIKLNLDEEFIEMIEQELNRRLKEKCIDKESRSKGRGYSYFLK